MAAPFVDRLALNLVMHSYQDLASRPSGVAARLSCERGRARGRATA